MTSLAETQRLFASVIDGTADAAQTARMHGLLTTGRGPGPRQRLAVYRSSSRRAREQALEAIYPVCRQVLGQRCFAGLVADYLGIDPASTADLNLYGGNLPAYFETEIRDRETLAGLPYLADLARLEWHWHAVYYAPDDRVYDAAGFAALAADGRAEQARFRLSAALRLLASEFPVHELWQRHQAGGEPSEVAVTDGDYLVIRRFGFRPTIEPIEPDVFGLLSALAEGVTLDALAADALPVERLPELIAAGLIVGFSVDTEA